MIGWGGCVKRRAFVRESVVMDAVFYDRLAGAALAEDELSDDLCEQILVDPDIDLFSLLHAAYVVRRHHWGKTVQVHVLNNAQNGKCPEDCSYCTQARTSNVDIDEYPIKSESEILYEARRAYEAGAFRYCLVFSGRGPSTARTEQLARLVRTIKDRYPLEVCVSAGLLDDDKAAVLAEAGLDRLNHNLNTSRERYGDICTTHTYQDRLSTIQAAKRNGLQTCSGLIAGMGEAPSELVEIAKTLRAARTDSIPVNFLLPFEGNVLAEATGLTPAYCLRVLAMFRFTNPSAEIRCAAGREFHLRSLEVMALYPANSLFLQGYLNAKGEAMERTYQMIIDAGFEIVSDRQAADVLRKASDSSAAEPLTLPGSRVEIKTTADLHPSR